MTAAQADAAPANFRALMDRGQEMRASGDFQTALEIFRSALAIRPREAWARMAVADALRKVGKADEADEACRALLVDEPGNTAALMALGHSLRGRGLKAEALSLFQAALALEQRAVWARAAVAATLRELGRDNEADEVCRALLADEPSDVGASMALGHSLRRRGEPAAALPLFQAVLAQRPREAWARMAVADTLRELGRADEANEACRALLVDEPENVAALMALGYSSTVRADNPAAVCWFKRAVRAAPNAPGPSLALANALRNAGELVEAAEAAQAVLARDPNHVDAWMSLGHTERCAGRRDVALRAFARASELAPGKAAPLVQQAVEERRLGRPETSELLLNRALELDGHDAEALQQLGEHHRLSGDLVCALDAFRRAVALPRCPSPRAFAAAAQTLVELGDLGAALRILDEGEVRLGAKPEIAAKRMELLRRTGNLDEAFRAAEKASRVWPRHFEIWFEAAWLDWMRDGPEACAARFDAAPCSTALQRGRVHTLRGRFAAEQSRFDEAIGHLTLATELNPDDGWPRTLLAQARLLTFDTEGAREELRRVSHLELPASKLQGRSSNVSQTHLGQLLDEFTLDRQALDELRCLQQLPPAERLAPLIALVARLPDHTAAAMALVVALRQSGHFAQRPGEDEGSVPAVRIPRIVAQYWDDADPPRDLAAIMRSWGELYPRFDLRRFNDEQARAFLTRFHKADVQAAYLRAREPAQKADIFRLAYLHSQGGFYADADDRLVGDLEKLRFPGAGLVLYQEDVCSLGNNFIGAVPNHPLIERALRLAVEAVNRGDNDILWLSTGPGLLTRAFAGLFAVNRSQQPLAPLANTVVLKLGELQRTVSLHCLVGYKNTERHWSRTAFGRWTAVNRTGVPAHIRGSSESALRYAEALRRMEQPFQHAGRGNEATRFKWTMNMPADTETQISNKKPRALVISPSGRVHNHDCVKWYEQSQKQIEENYFNIGDMVVFDSTLKMLDFSEIRGMVISSPPRHEVELYKNFDYIIVRASNFIHNEMNWHDAVQILEEIRLPVYALGVGGQASGREKYRLNDENLRFWKMVSERSKLIGVRGTYTADMLYANGIKNVEIVGCPSLFRARRRDLEIALDSSEVRRVAFSIRREAGATYTDDVQNYLAQQRDFLIRTADSYDTTVTIHGEPEEKAFFYNRRDLMVHAEEEFLSSGWWTPETTQKMRALYNSKLFFFLDVSEYDAFIRSQDAAIGYRVHGVLPALANGKPGVLVRYDSRSTELADSLAIPSVTAEEALRLSPRELLESVSFDEFNKLFPARYDKMKFLLEQNGIPHRL